MNRRGFLAALAGLPFVGKLLPKGQSFEAKYKEWPERRDISFQPCQTCGAIRRDMDKVASEFGVPEYDYRCGECGANYWIVMPRRKLDALEPEQERYIRLLDAELKDNRQIYWRD